MNRRIERRRGERTRRSASRVGAIVVGAVLAGGVLTVGAGATGSRTGPAASGDPAASCTLGDGVQHVVEITLDDAHFFRDNPNVPSDLELMPNLKNFIEQNGTLLSNSHTPLIANSASDALTTLTGLYGDRHGMPISNGYRSFNPDGTTDSAASSTYWTDPVLDTAGSPTAGHDTNPSMVYSATPPATTTPAPTPNTTTPAPWVPFTRAGCDVGAVGTTNIDLQGTRDIPNAFGPNSPEAQQLSADPNAFKDAEVADYAGVAVHCASGSAVCATAEAVKFGQQSASTTAVPDLLPDEPGGYTGFQALFGHRYVAPQLGAGTPNLSRNGFQVTNAAGNLVDENGNQLNGAFLTAYPGFPGFGSLNASQSLSYVADMQESGIPVTYADIGDIHSNENIPGLAACNGAPAALGSGSACYVAQAQYYNAAFGVFFQRLAADGITPSNTLFIVSSDEGDHEAGANVGRAIQPTPANCDGSRCTCTTPPAASASYSAT